MPDPWPVSNQIEYTARWGTKFKAHKALGTVTISNRPALHRFAEDCIEFGGWHGTNIHPDLASFQGYNIIDVNIET